MPLIHHLGSSQATSADIPVLHQYTSSGTWSFDGDEIRFLDTVPNGHLVVIGVCAIDSSVVSLSGLATTWNTSDINGNCRLFWGISNGTSSTVMVHSGGRWAGVALDFMHGGSQLVAHATTNGYSETPSITLAPTEAGQLMVSWVAPDGEVDDPGWHKAGYGGPYQSCWYSISTGPSSMTVEWDRSLEFWFVFSLIFEKEA